MVGQHVKHIRRSALNENRSVMAGMWDDDLEVSASWLWQDSLPVVLQLALSRRRFVSRRLHPSN